MADKKASNEWCPQCGREVISFFDHVDANCEEWPDKSEDDNRRVEYRGYRIAPMMIPHDGVTHIWYKPGSDEDWHGSSVVACYRAIDDLEDGDDG